MQHPAPKPSLAPPHVHEHRFASTHSLLLALALHVANQLEEHVKLHGHAMLLVPGGRAAPRFFAALRGFDLPWPLIRISLTDERWVPVDDPQSNEAVVREHLLQDAAARAKFYPLYREGMSMEAAATAFDDELDPQDWPPTITILGMGEDGHTASIFPSAPPDELERALNLKQIHPTRLSPIHPATSPTPRMTVTMKALLQSERIILLIPGAAKWPVYCNACAPGPHEELPTRALISQSKGPVEVWWSEDD